MTTVKYFPYYINLHQTQGYSSLVVLVVPGVLLVLEPLEFHPLQPPLWLLALLQILYKERNCSGVYYYCSSRV